MAGYDREKGSRKELRAIIKRLKKAEKELLELDPPREVFHVEAEPITAKLKSPSQVDEVERRLNALRQKVLEYRGSLREAEMAAEGARKVQVPVATVGEIVYCTKCGHRNDGQERFCQRCGEPLARVTEEARKSEKSPWNPSAFYPMAIGFGFGAAGILAGLNYRRLGKPQLAWPTAIVSVLAFVAVIIVLGFVLEIEAKPAGAFAVNIPAAFLLARLQRSAYEGWKERFPSARGGGWGIPLVTGFASLAVVGIVVLGAVFLVPDEAIDQYNRGVDLQDEGQFRQAIAAYDEAIRFDPEFEDAYHNRAICHAALGHYSEAIEDASRALELNPRSAQTYAIRGMVYADLGQSWQAIADLEEALDLGGLTESQRADVELILWELKDGG